jgi:hypothetical protein
MGYALKLRTAAAAGVLAAALAAPQAVSQKAADAPRQIAAQPTPEYVTPHTSWGVPDLGGTWSNASLTGLQRTDGASAVTVSEAEATALSNKNPYTILITEEAKPSKVDDASSKKLLSDNNANRPYNRLWMDPGQGLMRVRGEWRTSYITSPASGKIPFKPGARMNGVFFGQQNYDGPETRTLQEQCLSYGKAGPIITSTMYNNNIQMVQTPDHVAMLAEMIHEVRIIPIVKNAAEAHHGPRAVPKWSGDSVGWYEGNTLVVETVNPYWLDRSFISSNGKAVERWTRWSNDELLYQFTIDDPTLYTEVWSGEEMFRTTAQPIYEYACHEGNYGLIGILGGARKLESEGRKDPEIQAMFAGVGQEAE